MGSRQQRHIASHGIIQVKESGSRPSDARPIVGEKNAIRLLEEWLQLLASPGHLKSELRGFVEAWEGSINLQAGNFLGREAMSLDQMFDAVTGQRAALYYPNARNAAIDRGRPITSAIGFYPQLSSHFKYDNQRTGNERGRAKERKPSDSLFLSNPGKTLLV